MHEKKPVVPRAERTPNEVDKLRRRIRKLQLACQHDFRLIIEPELQESRVPGTFVGKVEQRTSRPDISLKLVCLKCSLKRASDVTQTCPKCLSPMQQGSCLGAGSRRKYFGEDYIYFSITLATCTNCGFIVASDEWDQ